MNNLPITNIEKWMSKEKHNIFAGHAIAGRKFQLFSYGIFLLRWRRNGDSMTAKQTKHMYLNDANIEGIVIVWEKDPFDICYEGNDYSQKNGVGLLMN